MAYTLQAVVAKSGTFPDIVLKKLQVLRLRCGIDMIPITTAAQDFYGIPHCPLTDGDAKDILPQLLDLCETLSESCKAAYIEAEFFGGDGTQANFLLSEGKVISPLVLSQNAINEALRFLGVNKGKYGDEFEAVGLSWKRFTDDWNSNDLPAE
ncbi:hypothetical protein [Undibacterium umbellatum]|uniref:Uncharacterized protein n=1 Tax=Undibacterium umbellatum TaxID=2762300 RepID=A0ABR6Z9S6_9BURK|nr:hypothetical protein [Undibacterium umbellatum]MBC3908518.1 hypothetical protein [Undibacterium umbellatum]